MTNEELLELITKTVKIIPGHGYVTLPGEYAFALLPQWQQLLLTRARNRG